MAELIYRKLSLEDVGSFIELRIKQLLEEGAEETCDLRPSLHSYYERHLSDGTFVSWLALDGSDIVATSGLSVVEKPPYFGCPTGRIGLISSMYTKPAYRRQGIARELLTRLMDDARSKGCGTLQITASDMGVHLYRSCGFTHNGNFMQLRL